MGATRGKCQRATAAQEPRRRADRLIAWLQRGVASFFVARSHERSRITYCCRPNASFPIDAPLRRWPRRLARVRGLFSCTASSEKTCLIAAVYTRGRTIDQSSGTDRIRREARTFDRIACHMIELPKPVQECSSSTMSIAEAIVGAGCQWVAGTEPCAPDCWPNSGNNLEFQSRVISAWESEGRHRYVRSGGRSSAKN